MTRLLLVEDDRGIADFLQRGLRAEQYDVHWVTTMAAAREAVENGFDYAILDLGLPDGDGMDLCRDWQTSYPDMGVLMLTARDAVESRVAGLDAGAEDYLVKPFAFDELLARLRVMQRRRGQVEAGDSVLEVGSLQLDSANREMILGGVSAALTERECLLLAYLMRHAGQAISRQQILAEAWAAEEEMTENAVDVYISYLRKKLDNRHTRLIQTVHGLGYKFVPGDKD